MTKLRLCVLTVLGMVLLAESPAAHHIMGIPHYAYSENYPQAPVITYKMAAGPLILEMTGYPGKPVPEEITQMHAYIYNKLDKNDVFSGPIKAFVMRESFGEREVIFGPVQTRFEENLHKFSPVYREAGKYVVRMEMEIEGEPYEIDLPIVVGDPSSPLAGLLGWLAALGLLVIVIRAIKIKRTRHLASQS
jgi:hypothetical protein